MPPPGPRGGSDLEAAFAMARAGTPREVTRATVVDAMRTIHTALEGAREELDSLNVFPVPDGDTGANLVMTVGAALAEVTDDAGPATRVNQLAHGCVRGARGNSGVIFSQVVRALLEQVGDEPMTTPDLAGFLGRAAQLARTAIADPLEGTILSALDEVAAAAGRAANDGLDVLAAMEVVTDATALAVARTRDVLAANREAGVVDAGARGLEVALLGLRAHLAGDDVPQLPPPIRRVPRAGGLLRESGSLEFQYEVQYLLEADDEVAAPLREELTQLGDSVVVVAAGGLLNVHVHTNLVEDAVATGERFGTTDRVEVHAFADQMDTPTVEAVAPRVPVGHVAVLPSQALADLVAGPGVTVVIGGPGSLPNVADLLAAAAACNAPHVVVLPGHRNAVPTALQAAEVSRAEDGPSMHVATEADAVPRVLAALAVADPDHVDLQLLDDVAAEVQVAEVVPAVRDASTSVGDVVEGELLVIVRGDIVAASHDLEQVRAATLDLLLADGGELVTLVAGAAAGSDEQEAWRAGVTRRLPAADVQLVDGDLPTSRWLVGVEGVPVPTGNGSAAS